MTSVSNGFHPKIGPDRPCVYTRPFWNRSRKVPNGCKIGPVFLQVQYDPALVPFQIRSGKVPEGFRVNKGVTIHAVSSKGKQNSKFSWNTLTAFSCHLKNAASIPGHFPSSLGSRPKTLALVLQRWELYFCKLYFSLLKLCINSHLVRLHVYNKPSLLLYYNLYKELKG